MTLVTLRRSLHPTLKHGRFLEPPHKGYSVDGRMDLFYLPPPIFYFASSVGMETTSPHEDSVRLDSQATIREYMADSDPHIRQKFVNDNVNRLYAI